MVGEVLVEYALRLFERGLIPIPLVRNSKHVAFRAMGYLPYHVSKGDKRLKDIAYQSLSFHLALEPPSEAEITKWFSAHDGNIGIVGGYRGLVSLDFDSDRGFERWSRHYPEVAMKTPVEKTPKGYHAYIRTETPVLSSSLYFKGRKTGHVKGLGGYIACGPSVVSSAPSYGWLPHRSPFDVELVMVPDLQAIAMYPTGWVRRHVYRLLGRGRFEPAEQMSPEEFHQSHPLPEAENAPSP